MKTIWNFIHGRFGNRVLKDNYRKIWVKIMYCLTAIIGLIMFMIFVELWSGVVSMFNYVFLGIG